MCRCEMILNNIGNAGSDIRVVSSSEKGGQRMVVRDVIV